MNKRIILLTAIIGLSACSSYSKGFDCQSSKGLGCKSISEVNMHVDQGKLTSEREKIRVWVAPDYSKGELRGSYEYIDQMEVDR